MPSVYVLVLTLTIQTHTSTMPVMNFPTLESCTTSIPVAETLAKGMVGYVDWVEVKGRCEGAAMQDTHWDGLSGLDYQQQERNYHD